MKGKIYTKMEKKIIDDFHGEYFFLSNFSESPLYFNGKLWPTVEHAFQAAKVDDETACKIHQAKTPGEAKRLGRRGTLVYRDWDDRRFDVMRQCLLRKFLCNPELLQKLLDTSDSELIEGNSWHDNTYGNCGCEKCKNRPGMNMLGKLLMEIRDKARRGMYIFAVVTDDSEYKASIKGYYKNYQDAAKWLSETSEWWSDKKCTPDDYHLEIIELK